MERESLKNSLILTPVVALMAIAGLYLYKDLKGRSNNIETVEEVQRTPIGTISYLSNNVKRKSDDTTYWSEIKETELVYDKDSIRTGPASIAQINLNDSSSIEVNENSLVILQKSSDKLTVDLKLGDLAAKGKSENFAVRIEGQTLKTNNASILAKLDQNKNTEITVREGKATLSDGKNTVQLDKQKLLKIDKAGKMETTVLAVMLKSPANRATLLSPDPQSAGLFVWDISDAKMPEQLFEISSTPDFTPDKTYARPAKQTLQAPIKRGKNYWRVSWKTPEGKIQSSETWSVGLENDTRVKITAPLHQANLEVTPLDNSIELSWESTLTVSNYLIEISETSDFTKLRSNERMLKAPYIVKNLPTGSYYWRVKALDKDNKELARSAQQEFSLRMSIPQLPELKAPTNGYRWTLHDPILFEWKKNPQAVQYRLTVAKSSSLRDVVKSVTIKDNNYLWKWTLPANYYWGVESLNEAGVVVGESLRNKFEITPPETGLGITLIQPKDQSLIIRERRTPMDAIAFEWRPDREVNGNFTLKISKSPDMKDPETVTLKEISGFLQNHALETGGSYFWRVSVADPKNPNDSLESAVHAFKLKIQSQLAPPQLIAPLAEEKLFRDDKEAVMFMWNSIEGAKTYRLVVERLNPSTQEFVATIDLKVNEVQHLSRPLDHGTYRWTVSAVDSQKIEGTQAQRQNFQLDGQRGLAAPKLKPPVIK